MESEMDTEFRFHLQSYADDLIRSGVPREEAFRRARLEFGGVEKRKEECRDARGVNFIEGLVQDLRYGLRTVRRSPGFTAVATLTLALGIGAATSMFTVVKAVMLSPLPFSQPENLVHVWEGSRGERYHRGDEAYFSSVRPGPFYDWRTQSQSFLRISAYRSRSMLLTGASRADLVLAHDVADQFFETLGTPAQLGRTLIADDYAAGAARAVVISNHMWAERFGKGAEVIGRRISLDRESYEIVGVMPAGFYPTQRDYPDLWTPHWANQGEKNDRVSWGLTTVARLKPGVTWEQAQTELDVVSARLSKDHPGDDETYAVVVPVESQLIGSSWKLLLLLSGGVALLLLIACTNVANLLLARAVDREKEFAIRTALGAGRGRLVLQLFTESVLLAVAAGTLGVLLASVGTRGLLALLPASALPRLDSVKVDLPVLGFVSGVTLLASLLFGLIPLLRAPRSVPYDVLKLEGRGSSAGKGKRRLGQIFVLSEFLFSLVLLILGALLVESFIKLQRVDPGFNASSLMVFRLAVPEVNYGKFAYGEKNTPREKLYEQLEQVLNAVPGVEFVALTARMPLRQEFNPSGVRIEGRELPPASRSGSGPGTPPESGSLGNSGTEVVNPQFFRALKVKLVSGRFLEERDNANAPMAAVVNETFARTFFPNEDPVGKRVTVWFATTTIVGVVGDFKLNSLDRKPYPEIFWSLRQIQWANVWVMARTKADPLPLSASLRQSLQNLDPDLPVLDMQTMTQVVADSLWLKRISAVLIGVVAVLAIVLAATGIYSVMSYSVSQRTREVGIRVALGASRRNVLGLVLGESCRLALLGSAAGCAAAYALGRLAMNQVYLAPSVASSQIQTGSLSPAAFVLSSLFLFGVAVCASYAPARRALRVDPMVALRHE
jgi:putative ABC transport system permease protein